MNYDALLVTKPENVYYLSRISMPEDARVLLLHSASSVVAPFRVRRIARGLPPKADPPRAEKPTATFQTRIVLFTDTRYREEIAPLQEQGIEVKFAGPGESARNLFLRTLKAHRVRRLGVEAAHLPVNGYVRLRADLQHAGIRTVLAPAAVERMREVKTKDELDFISRACQLSAAVLRKVVPGIRAGMQEKEAAWMLEKAMRENGADGPAFPFIVASGSRSAHPHGVASEKRIAEGEPVTIDFGAKVGGYHADMTRTFFMGRRGRLQTIDASKEAPRELKRIYLTVQRAQAEGIRAVRAGRRCRDIDRIARGSISRAGYGKYFVHSTGHGVGLAIHEAPTLSGKSRDYLRAGMVVTVEPGIYIPGVGGVRIEDTIAVTERGHLRLTA